MEEDIQNYYQMSCFVGHPVGQIRRQSAAARDMGRVPWLELKTGTKELSLCHKLWFSDNYIFGTKCCIP